VSPAEALQEARLASASGQVDRVRELYALVASAALSDRELVLWVLLLAEVGHQVEARAAADRIVDAEARGRLRSLLEPGPLVPVAPTASDETDDADPGSDPFEPDAPAHRPPEDAQAVASFLRWFGGRRDLHARQWFDESRERGGYRPALAPLTEQVLRDHLAGRVTVGQYLLFPDATVSFAVLDLDLSPSALAELRSTRGEGDGQSLAMAHQPMRAFALRLLDAGRRLGVPLVAEDSGGKGLHLWLFLEPRRPARAARDLLGQVVAAAGPPPAEVGLELFPKQDKAGPRGLSSLVKLPLGIHQASGRRCHMLDEVLQPILDPAVALGRLRAAEPTAVEALLGRRVLALPAPESAAPGVAPALVAESGSPRSLAEALRAVPAGQPEREACERMLVGCPVLSALVRQAYETHRLEPEQARALVYSLGLVGPEGTMTREVLAQANASTRELERVRRGLPSPVGCTRLKAMAAGLGVSCRCPQGAAAAPYATPALMAVGAVPVAEPGWKPFAAHLEAGAEAVESPLDPIRALLEQIDARLEKLERGR
jgi:hypothetical protein